MSEPVTHQHHIPLRHITDPAKVQEVLEKIYGAGNFEATWSEGAIDVMAEQEKPQNLLGKLQEEGC
ncbi:hypothetical protein FVEN_g12958 [Fusarium venenatum]|uniref:Uncharacterized protein n=1 Tax=Fusarium venenatum TaxID=56646 RepID=A0A2L2SVI0_9HYPO|nr:uncharacterized protein FVRRES_06048 [Fusarium venenatum]KAG8352582.1 hypothetical protein FVEN_g12958 [Fusarium venenatum]CEI61612.1 unnamed protein product [Fusarium venenatum]